MVTRQRWVRWWGLAVALLAVACSGKVREAPVGGSGDGGAQVGDGGQFRLPPLKKLGQGGGEAPVSACEALPYEWQYVGQWEDCVEIESASEPYVCDIDADPQAELGLSCFQIWVDVDLEAEGSLEWCCSKP